VEEDLAAQDERDVEVVIEGHTLKVGKRMYNIGTLVGTNVDEFPIGFDGNPAAAIWSKKRLILFCLIVFALPVGTPLRLLALAGLIAIAVRIVIMLQRRDTGYMLVLDTAGKVTGVITSRDEKAISDLSHRVAAAINHPPITAETYTIQAVEGDYVHVTGDNNTTVLTKK
jgi:hypothetical protein